ncbi:MAG: hypothetical protein SGILL_005791, partial [Bacillariaceae sp.]
AFGDDNDPDTPPKLASAAAVQNVVKAANDTWFIGGVNSGIWRSQNLRQDPVHWENVLDHQPDVGCTSISAMHVSQSYPNTVYAGCGGSTSGEQGSDWNVVNSGDWGGIMVSRDLGDTWTMMDAFPVNYYVTDILEIDHGETLLISAQSHLWNRSDGGIWLSIDRGSSFERVVNFTSTFTLTSLRQKGSSKDEAATILATHAHSTTRTASILTDRGKTVHDLPLPWRQGAVPFYTCAAQLVSGHIVIGGLTRLPGGLSNNTASQIFVLSVNQIRPETISSDSWTELYQPMSMDQDSMPKDRMTLLADPEFDDLLYVAGNAEALAWRVNTTTGAWTKLWDKPDVMDGSIPHGDCRNYAWDNGSGNEENPTLVLVSDGGIFSRIQPRQPGGRWISLNGDYAGLELLSAKYDPNGDRYVMGAQDNCAIVTKTNALPEDVGLGFVEGDGTVTMVDIQTKPTRLFGTTQFLGVGTIDDDPSNNANVQDGENDDDDDANCGGFCFVQGDEYIQINVEDFFPKPSNFPYFVHPYTLNRNDPTRLHIWVNGTTDSDDSQDSDGAFYEFRLPYSVKESNDIAPPRKLLDTPSRAIIMDFVSGGITQGKDDPQLLIGISATHLYLRSGVLDLFERAVDSRNDLNKNLESIAWESHKSSTRRSALLPGSMVKRALPITFAEPLTLKYDETNEGARILGPLTHARTASMAVSESESQIVAVTGWTDISTNLGEESIFVSVDGGQHWSNVTGNLRAASGVCGTVRPGGLLFVDLFSERRDDESIQARALLVGTSNGILVTFLGKENFRETREMKWIRVGELPIVLVKDVTYDGVSDRLVAATYGRGIYILRDAQRLLQELWLDTQ